MNINLDQRHSQMVEKLAASPKEVGESLSHRKLNLLHATIGISGEAGEVLDTVKKHVFYIQELNLGNLIEEMGDIEFYMELLRQTLGISRETVLEANHEKLLGKDGRYQEGEFSFEAAASRRDKAKEETITLSKKEYEEMLEALEQAEEDAEFCSSYR